MLPAWGLRIFLRLRHFLSTHTMMRTTNWITWHSPFLCPFSRILLDLSRSFGTYAKDLRERWGMARICVCPSRWRISSLPSTPPRAISSLFLFFYSGSLKPAKRTNPHGLALLVSYVHNYIHLEYIIIDTKSNISTMVYFA